MKKLKIFLILFFIVLILTNSIEIMENIRIAFKICINNLFPSLIPFMILSNILINYNFINDISNILGNFMTKTFKVNKNASFAFIMSILSGSPSNAKYLNDLLNNNLITLNDVEKCLNFCHFTNPIFILGTIGYTFLHDKKLGLIILISHYLSCFIGIFNNKRRESVNNKIEGKNKSKNFIKILNESIYSTISTLFLILGVITCFLIITGLIDTIFNTPNNYKFLYGILELTQGLNYLNLSNLSIKLKTIIASFFVSFGGFCIHIQVFSILDNKKIRYFPYLLSRLCAGVISALITFILLEMLY